MKSAINRARGLAQGAALLAALGAVPPAQAADIVFAVIGPHEYDLPVNFAPFNVFVQYGEVNNNSQAWNGNGNLTSTGGGSLWVGLSKYVRFFTIDGLPNVGFAYEVIIPEVALARPHGASTLGGVGDPLTGPAVWIKPNADSTLGLQSFMQFPVGSYDISNHYVDNNSSIFFDYQWPSVSLTGNAGGVFRGLQTINGAPNVSEAATAFFDVRVGWKNGTILEPFLGFDWDATGVSHYSGTNLVAVPASHEAALGAGVMANFDKSTSLTLRYSHDIEGMNTVVTNALYLKIAYVW